MSDHDHTDPLAFATAVFERWREQRATAGARVPPPLRGIACRLLDTEPLALVARSLRIAEATLRRWRARGDEQLPLEIADEEQLMAHAVVDRDDARSPSAFVPLPDDRVASPIPPIPPPPFATLVIERVDGVRLHLGGPIDVAAVAALVRSGAPR